MSVSLWINFWTFTLIATTLIFTCLAVAVAVGGFYDIRSLLRSIEHRHERSEDQNVDKNPSDLKDRGTQNDE